MTIFDNMLAKGLRSKNPHRALTLLRAYAETRVAHAKQFIPWPAYQQMWERDIDRVDELLSTLQSWESGNVKILRTLGRTADPGRLPSSP